MDKLGERHERKLRVVIVAASVRRPGGQAVQANRLLRGWQNDEALDVRFVAIDPHLPGWTHAVVRRRYARRAMTAVVHVSELAPALARADVVHVFGAAHKAFLASSAPAILIARALGRPVVLHYHNGEAAAHLERSPFGRAIVRAANELVVPSRYLVTVFGRFDIPATIIHNIVDLEAFRFAPRIPRAFAPRVLSTRNHHAIYNVACTLRAFQLVQRSRPDARLTVAGDGPLNGDLRALAATLGLANVRFIGGVEHTRMPDLLAAHDVYVQTPNVDNAPNSVYEAFASGLPVVSTAAGGVPLCLTDRVHGRLAPLDDDAAVARCILDLLNDPATAARLARSAYESCCSYTWARARERWLQLYAGLLAAQPSRVRAEQRVCR